MDPRPPFRLRAADDDGGDDGQEIGLAKRVPRPVQAACVEQAGESGQGSAEGEHAEAHPEHIDADCPRSLGAVAGRVDVRAVSGLAEDEISDPHRDDRPDDEGGHAEQRARAEQAVEDLAFDRHRLERRHAPRHAGENAHCRQGHEKGGKPAVSDEQPIERSRSAAPAPSPANTPSGHGHCLRTTAARRADTPTIDPIDRSISPDVSTNDHADRHDRDRRRLLDDVEEVEDRQRSRHRAG